MLAVAKSENNDPCITYLKMPMEDIGSLEGEYDPYHKPDFLFVKSVKLVEF